ncbi:hypothetical protein, partial [Halobacillus trueperi]
MKILYITSTLTRKANSASIRNVSLINGLIKNGVEVDVLTLNWPINVIDDFLEDSVSDKVKIYRDELFILNKYFNNKLKKGMYLEKNNSFYDKVKRTIKSIIKD